MSEELLKCRFTFNSPADFLLEIATHAYGAQNDRLVKKIQNGTNEHYRSSLNNNNNNNNDDTTFNDDHKMMLSDIRQPLYSSTFVSQFTQLMLRNVLFIARDKMLVTIRLLVHLALGLMIGFLYFGIGNEATQIFNIFRFVAIAVGFLAYSGFYSLMVRCKILEASNFDTSLTFNFRSLGLAHYETRTFQPLVLFKRILFGPRHLRHSCDHHVLHAIHLFNQLLD